MYFTFCSSVSIFNFEQVNGSWLNVRESFVAKNYYPVSLCSVSEIFGQALKNRLVNILAFRSCLIENLLIVASDRIFRVMSNDTEALMLGISVR